jgi:hypothetical protein
VVSEIHACSLGNLNQESTPNPRNQTKRNNPNAASLPDLARTHAHKRSNLNSPLKKNPPHRYQDSINVNLRSAYSIKLARVSDNTFEYDSSVSSPEALQVNGSALGFFGPLDQVPASLNPYQLNARWPSTELEETKLANTDMVLPHKVRVEYWHTNNSA